MSLELRILLCSFPVSVPLLLLHFRSDRLYRESKTSGWVGLALLLTGLYQAIAGVHLACSELHFDHWSQYVVMYVLFSVYCAVLIIPELRYAPLVKQRWR